MREREEGRHERVGRGGRKLTVNVDKVSKVGVPLRYLEHNMPLAGPRPPTHLRHGARDEDVPGAWPRELGEEVVVVCFSFLVGDGARSCGCERRVKE